MTIMIDVVSLVLKIKLIYLLLCIILMMVIMTTTMIMIITEIVGGFNVVTFLL